MSFVVCVGGVCEGVVTVYGVFVIVLFVRVFLLGCGDFV